MRDFHEEDQQARDETISSIENGTRESKGGAGIESENIGPRRAPWQMLTLGSTVWAPYGLYGGWRPAIITWLGKNRGDNTGVHLDFVGVKLYRTTGELWWRNAELKGKDKPKAQMVSAHGTVSMKKTSKPARKQSPAKKPPANKPITKQSSARPMRKAEGHSDELTAALTRLADDQRKVGEQVGRLIGITNKLVKIVEHLSEGVESLLEPSEDVPPMEQAEPGNEPQVEPPGEIVGVMVVDESENGDGEDEEE